MNLVPCLNRLKSPHRLRRHPMRTAPWMALAAFAAGVLAAGAQTVAFTNDPVATTYGGAADNPPGLNIGCTFTVTGAGIEVFQLGAFDWQGDGLNASHTVTLFHEETALGSVTIPAGTAAPLASGFRFEPLASPLYLPAGKYAVVAYQMNGGNATNDPYGENNASGFNGGGNVSPADGVFQFTNVDSPLYPNNVAGGYDFASASFTYTNVTAGSAATWTGGGADVNWSTAGNWNVSLQSPAPLTFAGSTGLSNTNDLTGFTIMGLTFDAAAGAFVLNGNAATLSGNLGLNGTPASPVTQTVNLPLTLSQDFTVDAPSNSTVVLGGDVTSASWLTKVDNGTLTLGGTDTFAALSGSGGTNIITGNVTFNGPSVINANRFYLADGDFINGCRDTMVIQPGATLSVTGTYGDAGVLGRDSGSATVIQNGGTFSYNPGNQTYLFVGASGNTATRSEYDMNGGVLDMNSKTLGIALGANAVITGLVNQVSGVITNVGSLYFDPFFTQGYGIYNLTGGSIYIGSGGITAYAGGSYELNLGGGTIAAEANWSAGVNMNLTGVNGPVTFNPNGYTITLSGALSGTGGLTVSGGGILELSGANTYTGDTAVAAGSTLQLDSTGSSSGALNLANGSTLNLNFTGTFAVGSLYTNGVALPVGTYNSGNLPGFIVGGGNLQVASGISAGYWTGLGTDNNWSTAANWDNNAVPIFPHALFFTNNVGLVNNNDLSAITISSLTFGPAAGAFVIGGNDVTLSGNLGFSSNPAAPVTETVNLNMTWNADKTIDTPANGNLSLGGNINASANTLTKIDNGTLTLGGSDTLAGYILNGGTNIITGSVAINGSGGYIYLGDANAAYDGTLIIQNGASLTVSGSFGDAMVIGRDGGSGTVIQNGGTFSYNSSSGYLFVGATSHAGTQAEYDMNGGVLDLNSETLGVALGDNGIAYTAVLNQTNGAINNVFKLDLGAVRAYGHGVYNLTGGSIAIDFGGITSDSGSYAMNLGGGTISAISSWSSSLNMTLTGSNGPVTFDTAGNTITLSGVLSGPGGLNVIGGGILELSGGNSYSGDTTVTAGVLQLDTTGSSAGAFRVVNGGLFNLNFSGNYAVTALYTNGVALPLGTYNSGNLPAYISGSGNLQVVGALSDGIWDGGGADNNWSTAGNWDNDAVPVFPHALLFAGNTRLNNTNDLSGITVDGITFSNTAGAFTLNGNTVTLSGDIGFSSNPLTPVTDTINLGFTPSANVVANVSANGNLALNGGMTGANTELTQNGTDNLGTMTLGGTNALKGLVINNGTNHITGTTTITGIGGSSFFYLGDSQTSRVATMVIDNGADLTVVGPFQDAAVLGRNGGVGTIVQNGGTFSFDINDGSHDYLFIGASGDPNTRAEYDMNGGVLDMNGTTLGVALGANAVVTGLVTQVSGVITNVGQLYFSPFFTQGHGIYTLTGGSLYIGSGGIINYAGSTYEIYLGGGTIGAEATWSSALNMTLTGSNGPVQFNPAGYTITLSGALSGSGGLTVAGSGTLELSGANSYSGDTVVNAGTLQLDTTSNGSGTIKVASGATLNLDYSGTMNVSSVYTNNVPLAAGTYNSSNLPGFIIGTGSIQVGAMGGSVPITFSVSGGQLTMTWPPNQLGATLQVQTNDLSAGLTTNWVNVAGSSSVTNVTIPISPSAPSVFYRLH